MTGADEGERTRKRFDLLRHLEGDEFDMKAFRWRLFWCIAPVAVALIVTAVASWNYAQSQSGQGKQQGLTFKLGVDLVGGTILVYEVDVSKFKEGKLPEGYRPEQLITALQRRI